MAKIKLSYSPSCKFAERAKNVAPCKAPLAANWPTPHYQYSSHACDAVPQFSILGFSQLYPKMGQDYTYIP